MPSRHEGAAREIKLYHVDDVVGTLKHADILRNISDLHRQK